MRYLYIGVLLTLVVEEVFRYYLALQCTSVTSQKPYTLSTKRKISHYAEFPITDEYIILLSGHYIIMIST